MSSLPIALTMGDPAGIGPEIVIRSFLQAPEQTRTCFVVGDLAVMHRAAVICGGEEASQRLVRIDQASEVVSLSSGCIPVLQVSPGSADLPAFGLVQAKAGRMAADAVRWAAQASLCRKVAALVTAPLNKAALAAAGEEFPGHTELLQTEAARHCGVPIERMPVRMMLMNHELRTVLVSVHVSLRQAIMTLDAQKILQTIEVTHAALGKTLGRAPDIAVAGLNPHAGEDGLFGSEEAEIIGPAVRHANAKGIRAHGPHPPDTVFMNARAWPGNPGSADVVIAMYHDQGLIPVKYLGLDQGVNVTLGLPLVRTSPDHGTAFDIAGKGSARPDSFLAAIAAARKMLPGV